MMSNLVLRDYQLEAVSAALDAVRKKERPVLCLPTGAGKSIVIAVIVRELLTAGHSGIVVTVPSRELAIQNENALKFALGNDVRVGVVCAALGRREFDEAVIVGTPQSLAGKLRFNPSFVIVDEAHQMPLHKGSWFARLFEGLPRGRDTPRIGLSATTFRTADGAIYGSGSKAWFTSQPYEMSVADLVARGHLAKVRYIEPATLMTVKGVSRTGGDYNMGQLVRANLDQIETQVRIILDEFERRQKALIFAVNVEHARAYCSALVEFGEDAVLIIGEMSASERRAAVDRFKAGMTRICVTVQAALTGFDVPDIDLIASCRPTMSPIIHTQSIGRGTRPAAGKRDCLVIDFAANIPMFGPVHAPHFDKTGQPLGGVAPWKACPACAAYNHFEAVMCSRCEEELTPRRIVTTHDLQFGTIQWTLENKALDALVAKSGTRRLSVESAAVHAYRKRSDPRQISLMLSLGLGGDAIVRVWFKNLKSPRWSAAWAMLLGTGPAPLSLEEAQGRSAELVRPASVTIEKDGNFWQIMEAEYQDAEEMEAA